VGGLWGMSRTAIHDQADHWVERFDMQSWMGESIEAYSHGMRQRLLLCAALLHQPSLLVLDEPMVGLDPRGAKRLKQVIKELAATKTMSVVLSTHTLDVVEQVCDTVAIIHKGKIVANGPLSEIQQQGEQRLEEVFLELTEQRDEDG